MIEISTLIAAGIGPTQARLFAAPLAAACERFGIDTPRRMAAFVAQCAHESRLFAALEESLFYRDPARICKIFRSCVPTPEAAQGLACNPKSLANHVYANRNGNRDEASGDGWRYRGRGLIQLTGRTNYTSAATALGRPYVDQPDLVVDPTDACLTAGWFWDAHRLNALADASRIDDITRAINGPAMAGAAERRALFAAALAAFEPATPAPASRTRGRSAPASSKTPAPIPRVRATRPRALPVSMLEDELLAKRRLATKTAKTAKTAKAAKTARTVSTAKAARTRKPATTKTANSATAAKLAKAARRPRPAND